MFNANPNTNIIGHNVSFSRSKEENLVDRLDGLVSIPQEWHKKKVVKMKQIKKLIDKYPIFKIWPSSDQ